MRITLTTKGLILVLVPLVFQIVFIAMLVHFLMQAEQSARQEYRSKTLSGRVTFLTAVLLANGTGAGGYIFTGKDTFKRHYESSKTKAEYELLYIPSLIGDDQQEQKDFKILEQNARDVINFMGENIRLADAGKLEEAKSRILSPKVDEYWAQIKNHSWQILETEEHRQQNMPETLPSTRARLKELIIFGVVCSFTISLLLLLAYSKNITTRLKIMMDNAARIPKGQMLNPRLQGSDEIASLDKVFHNMADALAEASRKERQLVAMVSHELRTPLTSIRGGLTLLAVGALGELPEKAREVVLLAERNSIRLVKLINDLLDIEKLEAGMLEMHFEDCDVDDIVRRALESVDSLAKEKNIRILFDSPGQAQVRADRDRIVQVLVNLLSNSLKFSDKDATIEIEVHGDEQKLNFSVTDHGRGIPAQYHWLLFQRFQQVPVADSKERGGSGLGLAICKAIVERHGGTIGVHTAEGEGSTFWFTLPLHEVPKHTVNSSDCVVVE
jgi:signal transduction histidine kinase